MAQGWPTSSTDPLCLGKPINKTPEQALKLSLYLKSP